MNTERQCCKPVYRGGSFRPGQCSNPAKLEHAGNWYCKTHHPPSIKAREDAKPKCSLCSTSVPKGVKYCSFHELIRITRDHYLKLVADSEELRKIKEGSNVMDRR